MYKFVHFLSYLFITLIAYFFFSTSVNFLSNQSPALGSVVNCIANMLLSTQESYTCTGYSF